MIACSDVRDAMRCMISKALPWCVWVYICICIYTDIHAHLYICIHTHIHRYRYVCVYIYMCVCMHIRRFVYMCVYAYTQIHTDIYVCVYVFYPFRHLLASIHVKHIYIYTKMSVYTSAYVSISVSGLSLRTYLRVYIHKCTCMCVYTYIHT